MKDSFPQRLAEIVAAFDETEERDFRSEILTDVANRFQDVKPDVARRPFPDDARVPQCESRAFVFVRKLDDGGIEPHFAVENPQGVSAKALATILSESLAGEKPEVIKGISESLVQRLYGNSNSSGKREGLIGMIRLMKKLSM